MPFIVVTNKRTHGPIVVNVAHIAHFYANEETGTHIGIAIPNHSGISVEESVPDVIELIDRAEDGAS